MWSFHRQIRDMVSDFNLGKLRMQFWHETLERIYNNIPPAQPVALELWQAVKQHNLTKRWLSRIIQSREANINDQAFNSLQDLETYSEATQTSLLFLTLESLGVRNVNADHAASHVGKALGIFTCLRSVPYNASHRRVQLPIDICMVHGASQEDIIRGRRERAIRDVVFDLSSQAHVHLQHAKSLQKNVPKAASLAFIQTVLVEDFLKRVRKVDFDVFHPSLQLRNPLLPVWMYWRSWRRSY
uniref:NADH dehydrogenase (ubiquinone) complex I, assembly factor 6 isoform X2 n=1 Tax=Myxine glutinosa TaxID=7769 RepID=UPI0035900BCF